MTGPGLVRRGGVRVTVDEADAMAVGCDEAKCWAKPGGFCRTPSGTKRRPHPHRVTKARDAGLLGGAGREWLAGQHAQVSAALILPQEPAGAC